MEKWTILRDTFTPLIAGSTPPTLVALDGLPGTTEPVRKPPSIGADGNADFLRWELSLSQGPARSASDIFSAGDEDRFAAGDDHSLDEPFPSTGTTIDKSRGLPTSPASPFPSMPTNPNQGPSEKCDGNTQFPTDTYTVNGASVDSGYVSAIASGLHSSGPMPDPGSMTPAAEEEFDAQTVYSDGASIDGEELDVYKAELVDNLVREARKLDASPEALERIFEALPALIKSFALQLGQPGSTKAQRDVMYFVYKYRQ